MMIKRCLTLLFRLHYLQMKAFYTNDSQNKYTRFEKLLMASISDALANSGIDATDKKTVLIISSTKGNISLLETEPASEALNKRISLNTSAQLVADHFKFANKPVIVSNACISGMLAMLNRYAVDTIGPIRKCSCYRCRYHQQICVIGLSVLPGSQPIALQTI